MAKILSPENLYKTLEKQFDLGEPRDWSEETLIYLALASYCVERLKRTTAVDMTQFNRELVVPSINRAWREMAYIRSLQNPEDFKDSRSCVKLTRFGNIIHGTLPKS